MASSISSTVTHISTSRVIQRGLEQLSRVKSNDFSLALKIIEELGHSFASIDDLTAVSKGRVAFLGDHLLTLLDRFISIEPPHEVVAKLITALANLKNALQMEAANFGWVYHPIQVYSQLNRSPHLRELQAILPEVLHKIKFADQDHFVIDAEPIQRYFASVDIRGLTNQFDLVMITLMSEYHFEGSTIRIPLSKIPPIHLLERYLGIEDIHCKLVIQILYACGIQYSLMRKHVTGNELVQKALFDVLEKTELGYQLEDSPAALASPEVKYNFHNYLEKKPLIPLFSAILEERDLYMARGGRSIDMLVSEDFISRITPMLGEDWLEESAEAYDLIRRIEISCRKIFPRGFLGELDELIRAEASDPLLTHRIAFMNREIVAWHGRTSTCISPEILHSGSKEQFKLFAFYQFIQTYNKKGLLAKPTPEEDDLSVKMPSGKKDPSKSEKPTKAHRKGGAGSTSRAPDSPLTPDAGAGRAPDPVIRETPGRGAGSKAKPAITRVPYEGVENSGDFLRGISLHPRVNAWNKSPAAGLAYYGYGSGAPHVLPQDEMILRHRFPPEMLSLLFSDLYSKESRIQNRSGELCRHFESVLNIDGRKYMLEATVDARGILFHYYARPLTNFADYFHLTRESPSEFPELPKKEEAPTPLARIPTKEIHSDEQGNAIFEFDGHAYKVLLLRMP
jgi:hypothetical protein